MTARKKQKPPHVWVIERLYKDDWYPDDGFFNTKKSGLLHVIEHYEPHQGARVVKYVRSENAK